LMRQNEEAERVVALGAKAERVFVTGNTKFDALVPSRAADDDRLREAMGLASSDVVWLCGSTHEGEEDLLLDCFGRLLTRWPTLKLVLAPRYIDRAARVCALAQSRGHQVALRSAPNANAKVVVLDTIGELARAYRLATLVFVGGSFTSRGGQNILEPAAQGRAVLFGPHMQNFQDSVQLLVGRGGIQVNDGAHLEGVINELLEKPSALERLGAMAEATVRQVSGASRRNVEHIVRLLARVSPR
jgi:3-deoxy-D-manno-octulosonic-acid transferase